MVRLALDARGQLFVAGQLRGTVDPGTGPLTSAGRRFVVLAPRFDGLLVGALCLSRLASAESKGAGTKTGR